MPYNELVANTPIAVALLWMTREFLRHASRERALDRGLWTNHLSQAVEAQTRVAEVLRQLVDEVKILRTK